MGEGEYLYIIHPNEVFANEFDDPLDDLEFIALERQRDYLRPRWETLYKETLPALARSKSPKQRLWPVSLDHCFARIIFDAVIGNSTETRAVTPEPWTHRLESPAIRNIHPGDLDKCIKLGEAIADGSVDLVDLDRRSLAVRGKLQKGGKRKREDSTPTTAKKPKSKSSNAKPSPRHHQPDIRTALGFSPSSNPSTQQQPPLPIPHTLHQKITTHPALTPFRRRVLLALCHTPSGHYTTYAALSRYLHSSPRAVGNALRNNPFAPEVPCHRVVAADGGIGGFGGEWGVEGKWCREKVRLLRGEGVKIEEGGGVCKVKGRVWDGREVESGV